MILHKLRNALDGGNPSFVVNTAAAPPQVAVTFNAGNVIFFSPSGTHWFEAGDNTKLRAVEVLVPHALCQGGLPGQLFLRYEVDGVGVQSIPEFDNDTIDLSSLGCVTEVGIRLAAPLLARWHFIIPGVSPGQLNISMAGIPSSLNGLTLIPVFQLDLEHTRPLTA